MIKRIRVSVYPEYHNRRFLHLKNALNRIEKIRQVVVIKLSEMDSRDRYRLMVENESLDLYYVIVKTYDLSNVVYLTDSLLETCNIFGKHDVQIFE